jgi:hypothetical protein
MKRRKCLKFDCERRAVCHIPPGHEWWYCAEHYDEITSMKPKTMIVAPDIPASEVMMLRAHIDEAVTDPDYSILISYEVDWE